MKNAKYVDGFVFPVPNKNTAAYRKLAKEASVVWKRFGALDYKECMIDDAKPKGIVRTFAMLTKPKKGESVWFSFVTYKSRAHRDAVNKKVMAYFAKKYPGQDMSMPFDIKRMSYAGFKVEVSI